MAFDVTPTSGAGPYNFTSVIDNPALVDGVVFSAEFRGLTELDSCPLNGLDGSNNAMVASELLANGSYSASAPVGSGSCRAFTFLIRRLENNAIVSQSTVFVDNV